MRVHFSLLVALATLSAVASNRASANTLPVPAGLTDVMAGLSWTNINDVSNYYGLPATTLTTQPYPGNLGMYPDMQISPTINYDLGSPQSVDELGADFGIPGYAARPINITLEFSNDNFSTISATRTLSFSDVQQQYVSFARVTAEFVEFVFPTGTYDPSNYNSFNPQGTPTSISNYYWTSADTNVTSANVQQLQLYAVVVPEPSSVALAAGGAFGLLLAARRRRG